MPRATACPMRAPPRSDPILPGCYCEPADAPEISAKMGPLGARHLCYNCPSLPRYATGKRAINSLSEITQNPSELCLHFGICLQCFRAIWSCSGYKSKMFQQPASDRGLVLVLGV